jgi:hypothetical protein
MFDTEINVFCDNQIVFSGLLSAFLADNDDDEGLMQECAALETQNTVEFFEISGHWVIKRIGQQRSR